MKFLDLFAGIGGFRRGMEMAGHECVGFCEWDKYATASYTSMHLITDVQRDYLSTLDLKKRQKEILKDEYRNEEWYSNDIRNVDARSVPKADCWCFGAPCQDFSIAGKRAGLDGDRSSLVREVFRILGEIEEESRPEWLIYENVKGMFSSNRGFDYLEILLAMDELGYDCEWQLFNSKDWGVPQNRERVYTVGHLRSRGTTKIFPITGADGENSVPINQIGRLGGKNRENPQRFRVYDPNGAAPTLNCMGGGNLEPYTVIPICNTNPSGHGMNGNVYDSNGLNPALTTNKGEGNKIAITISEEDIDTKPLYNQRGVIHSVSGISRTVLGCGHSGNEPKVAIPICKEVNCINITDKNGKERSQQDRVYGLNGVMTALNSQLGGRHNVAIPVLTPDRANKRQNGRRFKEDGEPMFTLTGQDRHGVAIEVKEDTKQGYSIAHEGDSINLDRPGSSTRRGRVGNQVANTLDTSCNQGIFVQVSDELTVYAIWYEKYQCYIAIRKLTPKECFRLQGWTDDYFEKAQFVNSDSQLYKQAGNGVTVNVVYEIGKRIPL